MKKLLLSILVIFFGLSLYGNPKERLINPAIVDKHVTDWVLDQLRNMGYTVLPEIIVQDTLNRNKQKIEYDDLYYQPSKDAKRIKHQRRNYTQEVVDTLVKENPDIQVNYINNYDPFFYSNQLGMFYHGGFNYWHYNPFFYDPWYDFDFGWGWNPYYGYNYSYWNYPYYNNYYFGWNLGWGNYRPYYWHNNNFYGHNHNGFNQPQYGHKERPSNLAQVDNRRIQSQQRMNPQDRPTYNKQNRRSYQPSYNNPRMSERPLYNNSRVNNGINYGGINNRRTQISTQSRTQTSTERRTYSPSNNRSNYTAPSRAPSTAPSRSYGESRSSNNSFSGGGMDRRSSGSSNFSSGGGSSSSGGGRSSSGGGSSSGRR